MSKVSGRFEAATDRLVSWTPAPFERFLTDPLVPPADRAGSAALKVVRFTLRVSLVMVLLLVAVHLVDALVLHPKLPSLDADDDHSVWSWASVGTEFLAAGMLGLFAATSTRSVALQFCAWVVTFLSLDDFIRIHEKLGAEWSLFPHSVRVLWPVLYLPLLGSLFLLLWRVAQGLERDERALVRAGLLALVVAVGLEFLTPFLFAIGQGHGSLGYETEVAVEEGLELGGWLWIAGGLAAGVLHRSIGVETRPAVEATALLPPPRQRRFADARTPTRAQP